MEGAKMVDKTNMSLDDIIKMDRKNLKGKRALPKNKNSMARNVVKKARNSFITKKPLKSPKKNFPIAGKRQDARSKLIRAKQLNTTKKIPPKNIQRTTRNSNFQRQNRSLNTNIKPRINRNNSNAMNSVPAFRITTNNERYQSNNQRGISYDRFTNKRISANNNVNAFSNRFPYYPFPGIRRPMNPNEAYYPISNRNGRSDIRRNPILARDREYEAMARALIEAHRESRHTFNQPTSSQRRYSHPMESRGYPYRR